MILLGGREGAGVAREGNRNFQARGFDKDDKDTIPVAEGVAWWLGTTNWLLLQRAWVCFSGHFYVGSGDQL